MAWVYGELDALGSRRSRAAFVSVMAVARPDGEVVHVSEGRVVGDVAPEPRGQHGFGYDPVFFYPPSGTTTAEMPDTDKAAISHRGRAFRDLRRWLESEPASLLRSA